MKIKRTSASCSIYQIKLLKGTDAAEFESFMLNEVIPGLPIGTLTRVGSLDGVRFYKSISSPKGNVYIYLVYGSLVGKLEISRIQASEKFKVKITELGEFDEIVGVKKRKTLK